MNELFKIIVRNKLTPNGLYILNSMIENVSSVNLCLEEELLKLKKDKWITNDNKITDKAKRLINEVNALFKKVKKKTNDKIMGNNYNEKIDEYNQLFPKMKLPTGKAARSSKSNLENAFRWFFQNHDYDWETVLKATNAYLTERKLNEWKFTRNSQYFIRKQVIDKTWESSLANWCLIIEDGLDETVNPFQEKVF
jgi:hypothetical protein